MTQTTKSKTLRIVRKCIVNVYLDDVESSGPTLAVLETDQIIDYDTLLRQINPEENVLAVEWTGEFTGATVEEELNGKIISTYDYEEEDLSGLKDLLESSNWPQKQ